MVQGEQLFILDEIIIKKEFELFQKKLRDNYSRALKQIDNVLVNVYEKYEKDGVLSYSEMTRYNRLTNMRKSIRLELNKLGDDNIKEIDSLSKNVYEESYFRTSYALSQDAGVSGLFGRFDPKAIEKSLNNPLDKIAKLSSKTRIKDRVNRTITESLTLGESYFKLTKKLKKIPDTDIHNWERIARTEVNRVQNEAIQHSYNRARNKGVELTREWVAALDDRTRSSHAAMDGQREDGKGLFTYPGGVKTAMPGQGPAAEVINCRCRTIGIIPDFEPTERRIRGEGIVKDISFIDWAKKNGYTNNRWGEKYLSFPEKSKQVILQNAISEKYNIAVDYSKLNDFAVLDTVHRQLDKLSNRYDFNFNKITGYDGDNNTYATYSGNSSTLRLNAEFFNDRNKFLSELSKNVKTGFHPAGCNTIESIITHEYYHSLTADEIKKQGGFYSELNKVFSDYAGQNYQKENKNFISKYAVKSPKNKIHEFCAESMTMVDHAKNPSSYAKRVADIFKKYYINNKGR